MFISITIAQLAETKMSVKAAICNFCFTKAAGYFTYLSLHDFK